jgi:NAD(P)-dependent dehydrogenase (short-subunit alcohol dehydrogenase family)
MKILLIGASGTIGKKLQENLSQRHEIVTAGRNSGDIRVDISAVESIKNLFEQLSGIDACICTAGSGYQGNFQTMTEADLLPSLKGKLLGQVNVVLIGQHFLNENGSFTVTSGILADDPAKNSACGALISGALNSFVFAASLELKREIRINAVSPGIVEDSFEQYGHEFPGFNPVPMTKVINAYLKSVEGVSNGQILKVYG